ncbi:hypothetical protein PR048_032665 [Dryococelus australis]|uniref:Dynein heavy chain linker domain-containing protein n=1 Tax=Dryococelus australis TaxID=614101 RepID=A0ABQ9G6Y3_9NEOP|nr:hypothetical protein PR048_032665 [Dryococelus australis]
MHDYISYKQRQGESCLDNIRLVQILCNPALIQRHWDEMSEIIGVDLTPNAGTTLRKMIKLGLDDVIEQ